MSVILLASGGLILWNYFSTQAPLNQLASVVVPITSTTTPPTIPEPKPVLYQYLEVIDGCDPYYQGTCVNMRSGPGPDYSVVSRLRTGMVLKIAGVVTGTDGEDYTTTKHITVDLSQEMLYAYDGDTLFMQEPISTGLEYTPTPRGTFTVFAMTPSRYMQGPLPGVSS